MEKKVILGAMFVLFLLVSPFVIESSALSSPLIKKMSIRTKSEQGVFPFRFFCQINSSGYGIPDYSGDNIFIGIRHYNATIIIKSLFRETELNGMYNLTIFCFIGNTSFPPSGVEGYCHLKGWAMLVNIF